jgi:hypothetical protein
LKVQAHFIPLLLVFLQKLPQVILKVEVEAQVVLQVLSEMEPLLFGVAVVVVGQGLPAAQVLEAQVLMGAMAARRPSLALPYQGRNQREEAVRLHRVQHHLVRVVRVELL